MHSGGRRLVNMQDDDFKIINDPCTIPHKTQKAMRQGWNSQDNKALSKKELGYIKLKQNCYFCRSKTVKYWKFHMPPPN